jgi:hypothetical protein
MEREPVCALKNLEYICDGEQGADARKIQLRSWFIGDIKVGVK